MKLKVDRESDALYFRLDETATIIESEGVQPFLPSLLEGRDREGWGKS